MDTQDSELAANQAGTSGASTDEEAPSKSELKRRKRQVQELATELAQLKDEKLRQLPFDDHLLGVIQQTRTLKSGNARNRMIRHLANLLVGQDQLIPQIVAIFEKERDRPRRQLHQQKIVDQWCERLLENSEDALKSLFDQYPQADRQQVRSLLRSASKQTESHSSNRRRKLFLYLRDQVINID